MKRIDKAIEIENGEELSKSKDEIMQNTCPTMYGMKCEPCDGDVHDPKTCIKCWERECI